MERNYIDQAKAVRRDVLKLIHKGQTSHIASCLSAADIGTVLFANKKENDVIIFSKGWASALWYVLCIHEGKLDREEVFNTFPNYPYPALLEPCTPGVFAPTGSVGQGLGVAVGMALGKKLAGEPGTVYCLLSDGELNEGSTWEAALLAGHHKLDNLVAIVDSNGWQAMGKTEDVASFNDLKVFEGFGWGHFSLNGHRHTSIEDVILTFNRYQKPLYIKAHTEKGHGVSFMANHLLYHYKHISDEDLQAALTELQ